MNYQFVNAILFTIAGILAAQTSGKRQLFGQPRFWSMNKIAYLANSFPEAVEPYVWEEIRELRRRGKAVVACSFRHPGHGTQAAEMASETTYLFPLNSRFALHACWIFFSQLTLLVDLLWRAVHGPEPIQRKVRTLVHTWLGAYLAAALRNKQIAHIHIHHGYFSFVGRNGGGTNTGRDIQHDLARFRPSGPGGLPGLQTQTLPILHNGFRIQSQIH